MLTDQATVYRFGEFTFDAVSGDLRREGEDTRLQPQPLQVLLLLLHEPGRLVSRHELCSTLWPQDTYIEFDDGLNHAIRRLREALGDTAQLPRFIETVPRRGYRFIASVQTQLLSEVPVDPGAAHRSPEHRFNRRLLVGPALISLVFLAFSGFIIHILHRSAQRVDSLAVLPLTNFSDDPTQEHFADGITEELTTELSRTTSARIISRTSSMRLKKTKLSLQEIGRELRVDAVIEGSVQRSGDRVRISAQLVQLPTERHLWAQSYERDLKDILRVRSEVSREIAAQVRKRLAMPDRQREHNISPEAYDAYLMGTRLASRGDADSYGKSISYLERVIALDPTFALAYTELAESHAMLAFWSNSRGEHYKKAVAYSNEALRLDPSLPEAQLGDADLKFYWQWDWTQCGGAFRKAAEAYPNSEKVQYHYGLCLYVLGRHDEALRYLRNAHQLDPLSPMIDRLMARLLAVMRRDREAIELLVQARDLEPDNSDPYAVLAFLYRRLGNDSEAAAAYINARRLLGRPISELESLDRANRTGGAQAFEAERRRQLQGELKTLLAQKAPVQPRVVASLCASIPDANCAMQYLETAYNDRDPMLSWLKSSLAWESLHNDPRYHAVIQRIGLPD